MIIHETMYNVTNKGFDCGNCSKSVKKKSVFIEGWTCTIPGSSSSSSEVGKVTILDAIDKIFNLGIQTGLDIIIGDDGDGFKLCSCCGERLRDLYLHYYLFTQLNALNSKISNLIKIGEANSRDPLRLALSGKELKKCQSQGHGTTDGPLNFIGESLPVQVDGLCPIFEFKTEEEEIDTIPLTPEIDYDTEMEDSMDTGNNSTELEDSKVPCLSKTKKVLSKPKDKSVSPKKKRRKPNRSKAPCPHCGKVFTSFILKRHIDSVHLKLKPFKCDSCDYVCSFRGALQIHQRDKHINPGKSALCTLCGKEYKNETVLKEHMKRHLPPENPCRCDICDKEMFDAKALRFHKLTHVEGKNHLCDICGKGFKTKYNLINHKRHHWESLEKPIQCPLCDQRFGNRSTLKNHLMRKVHGLGSEEARQSAGIGEHKIELIANAPNFSL